MQEVINLIRRNRLEKPALELLQTWSSYFFPRPIPSLDGPFTENEMLIGSPFCLTLNGLSSIIAKAIESHFQIWAAFYAQMVILLDYNWGNLHALPHKREKGRTISVPKAAQRNLCHHCLGFTQRLRHCLSLLALYPIIQINNVPYQGDEMNGHLRRIV